MTLYEIWIASHISSLCRLNTLRETISSCYSQTICPQSIVISISFTKEYSNAVSELVITHTKIDWLVSDTRKTQFQHYYNIWSTKIDINPDTFIIFADDDDILSPKRIEIQQELTDDENVIICNFISFKGVLKQDHCSIRKIKKISEIEYWQISPKKYVIDEIFDSVDDPLLSFIDLTDTQCDWHFKTAILQKMDLKKKFIPHVLYYYRICKSIKKDHR